MNEPLQFYSGKEPMLYRDRGQYHRIAKNQISGYLSTPKNAPVPSTDGNRGVGREHQAWPGSGT